jgi:hypothetical protein
LERVFGGVHDCFTTRNYNLYCKQQWREQ